MRKKRTGTTTKGRTARRLLGAAAVAGALLAGPAAAEAGAFNEVAPEVWGACKLAAPSLPGHELARVNVRVPKSSPGTRSYNNSGAWCDYIYISGGEYENGQGLYPAGIPAYRTTKVDWNRACELSWKGSKPAWKAPDNSILCRIA